MLFGVRKHDKKRVVLALLPPLVLLVIPGAVLTYFVWWLGAPLLIFGALDTYGRYNDYKYLISQRILALKVVDYYGRSFCGRQVICSIGPHWRGYYRSCGYQWWHLLPVGFPHILMSARFWRALALGHRNLAREDMFRDCFKEKVK